MYAEQLGRGAQLAQGADQFAQQQQLRRSQLEQESLRTGASIAQQAGEMGLRGAEDVARMQFGYIQEANQIQQNMARLQQQAWQTEIETELKDRQLQQQALMDQQRNAIDREYRRGMIGMQSQRLQSAQSQLDFKIRQAQEQQGFRRQFQQRIAGGEDPTKTFMELAPSMGMNQATLANIYKPQRATIPGSIQYVDEKGMKGMLIENPNGTLSWHPATPERVTGYEVSGIDHQLSYLRRKVDGIEKKIETEQTLISGSKDKDVIATSKTAIDGFNAQIAELEKEISDLEATRKRTIRGGSVYGKFSTSTGSFSRSEQ